MAIFGREGIVMSGKWLEALNGRVLNFIALLILTAGAPVAAAILNNSPFLVTGAAIVVAFIGYQAYKSDSNASLDVLASALIAQNALITGAFTGHPWQLDTHLLYFALLAVISVMGSPRALILSFVLIYVHHISLSFIFPSLVYPGGTWEASLSRSLLHAPMVALEVFVLLITMKRQQSQAQMLEQKQESLNMTLAASEETRSAAEESRRDAEAQKAFAEQEKLKSDASKAEVESVVATIRNGLQKLANKDLNCEIHESMPVKYQELGVDFNAAVAQLKSAMSSTVETARDVDKNAVQLASAMQDVTARNRDTATSTSETASALRDLTGVMRTLSDNVVAVTNAASEASDDAQQGVDIANRAIGSMQRISDSSNKISNVIVVIDAIAFQTNLLALNASVEAARAGEAGRGFAVVASEVRQLAQRAADSANEIKSLVEASEEHVQAGVQLVQESGKALDLIVEKVKRASEQLSSVNADLQSNTQNLGEMNRSVATIDDANNANAAMVQELAKMGDNMAQAASDLIKTIEEFKLGAGAASSSPGEQRVA
ncbi:MAG: methyl-accepting chemotaxis protein [Pseudomonadota bacterium]